MKLGTPVTHFLSKTKAMIRYRVQILLNLFRWTKQRWFRKCRDIALSKRNRITGNSFYEGCLSYKEWQHKPSQEKCTINGDSVWISSIEQSWTDSANIRLFKGTELEGICFTRTDPSLSDNQSTDIKWMLNVSVLKLSFVLNVDLCIEAKRLLELLWKLKYKYLLYQISLISLSVFKD